ncbi:MAG: metal-dependent hydrolase [Halobacterium sp.]
MYRTGHYGAALLAYSPVLYVLASRDRLALAAAGASVVWLLATLPDVDHRIPFVEHRGVTHTVAFATFVGALAAGAAWAMPGFEDVRSWLPAGAGGVAGLAVVTHLVADALTPAGVAFLWPASTHRFSLGVAAADSRVWNAGLLTLGVLASALAALAATPLY